MIAISAKGDDTLEFNSLHEASKWAGLGGAADIKRLIDSGEECCGVFFDWADEREKNTSVVNKEKDERIKSNENTGEQNPASKWKDPEFKRQWRREWYLAHKEEMRSYMRAYIQKHKADIAAYRAENAEKIREQKRAWREKNADKIREYNREYHTKRMAERKKGEKKRGITNYSRE